MRCVYLHCIQTGDAFAHSVAYLSPTSSAHRSTHRRMTTTILAIGAPGTSDGGTHTHGGAVYMVFIDIDGDIETYHQLDAAGTYFGSGSNEAGLTADEGSMYTLRSYDRFGSSVVGVRDVNEDGYTDIVIGAALADEYDDSDVLHAENTGTAILVLLDADAKVTTHTMFNNYKLGEVEAGSLLGTQLAYLDSYFAPAETAMTRVMVGAPFDDDDDPANEGGSVFIATLHTSLTPSIELREVVSLQFEEVGYGYIITQTFTIHFDNYQHTEPAAFSISTDMDTRPFVAHSHDVSIFNLDVTNSLYDDARVEYVSGSGTIIQSPLDDTGSGAATITEAGDAYSISLSHLPRDAVLSFSAACKLTTHVSYKEELTGTLTLTYDTDTVVGGGVGSHYGTSAVTEALDSVITLNYTTNHAPVLASTETNFAFVEGQSVYLDTISVSDIDFNLLNRSSLMQFEINVTNGGAVGLTYVDAVYIEEVTGTDKFDFSYCKFRCRLDVANLALPSLQYTGDVVIGDVEVQISVSDEGNCGKGGPKMDSISVNVSTSDANTAPTIGGVLLVEIDEEETILFTGPNAITVADEDAGTNDIILTATATYGTLQHTHDGATDPAIDAVCVITADDQVATITGDVTAINAFVEYLQFTPLQDLNMLSTGEDFVYFVINDQGHANSGAVKTFLEDAMTTVIQIAAVNDAPVCGVPSSPVTAAEGTYRTISDVTVDDVDVTETFGGYMQASVTATLGTVTLSSKVGLYITTGDGDDDANVVMQGSVNSIKAALEDMQYLPPSDYDGNDVIAISLSDLGNTGSGGTLTADCSITVSVSSVNDAAVLTAPTVIYGTESATTLITGVSFVDSDLDDSAEIDATVSVNIGTLFVTTGLATTYADDIVINADENEIVFTANKATLNTLLGGINVESPESFNGPGTEVSITIDDKAGGVTTAIVYVNLVSVNGAPIITSATPYSCNEDEWLTLTGLEIDDPDIGESFTAVLKATITVTGGSVKLAPDANGGYPFYFIQGGPGGDGIGASSYR